MYIYGRNPVIEALRSNKEITKIFIRFGTVGSSVEQIKRLARDAGVPVSQMDKQKFDRIGNNRDSQGIVALVEEYNSVSLEELLADTREQDPPFFLAVDNVTDPRNLGAILRTAECAGVHGVILPQRDTAPITDTVVKTSAGATSHIRIARVGNLNQALEKLKEAGIWVAGLDAEGETDLLEVDGFRPVCLVVGSEGKGLRPLIKKSCEILIRIPMWGRVDSLNASVAAALVLYEVRRKRL
jgi:23S rRNA (guanosine2251-2'-O)-methyltransferase